MSDESHTTLCALLIHEICHAHAPRGHGMAWQLIMKDKVNIAREMHDDAISEDLMSDLGKRWSLPPTDESAGGLF